MGALIVLLVIIALLFFAFVTGFAFDSPGIFLIAIILAIGVIGLFLIIIRIFAHLIPYLVIIGAAAAIIYFGFKSYNK